LGAGEETRGLLGSHFHDVADRPAIVFDFRELL
jgi:hypothetical protein